MRKRITIGDRLRYIVNGIKQDWRDIAVGVAAVLMAVAITREARSDVLPYAQNFDALRGRGWRTYITASHRGESAATHRFRVTNCGAGFRGDTLVVTPNGSQTAEDLTVCDGEFGTLDGDSPLSLRAVLVFYADYAPRFTMEVPPLKAIGLASAAGLITDPVIPAARGAAETRLSPPPRWATVTLLSTTPSRVILRTYDPLGNVTSQGGVLVGGLDEDGNPVPNVIQRGTPYNTAKVVVELDYGTVYGFVDVSLMGTRIQVRPLE